MYFRMHRNVSVDKKKNDLDVPRTLKIVCINVRENIISIGKKKALQNKVVENFAVYKNYLRVFIMNCRSFVDVFMACTKRP